MTVETARVFHIFYNVQPEQARVGVATWLGLCSAAAVCMCEKYREIMLIVGFTDQSNEDGRKEERI